MKRIINHLAVFAFLAYLAIPACNPPGAGKGSGAGPSDTTPGVVRPPVTDTDAVMVTPPIKDSNVVVPDTTRPR